MTSARARAVSGPAKRVQVPHGVLVYAIGDIHGRADLLAELHEAVIVDSAARAAARRVLVYLGDYVSRGRQSRRVVDMLLEPGPPGFERVRLLGNHEELLLRFLDGDLGAGMQWLDHGGDAMLEEYGIDVRGCGVGECSRLALLRERLQATLPREHDAFFRSLRTRHQEGDFGFVHAGVRPGVPFARQSAQDLISIRAPFLESCEDHGLVIVHGHSISETPEVRHNRIGIDTGAYWSGVLSCLVLQGTERAFLQTASRTRDSEACPRSERNERS